MSDRDFRLLFLGFGIGWYACFVLGILFLHALGDGSMIAPDVIPFHKDFIPKIRNGTKTMTTRERRYKPGHVYRTLPGDVRIFILRVQPETLGIVAEKYYRQEGCESPADFMMVWRRLHRGHFNPKNVRWLHEFRLARL